MDLVISKQNLILTTLVAAILIFAIKAADPLCENYPPNQIFTVPHEYNCSLYYECLNGEKTIFCCEDGLYFNNKTQACDFPSESGCRNGDPQCAGVDLDYLPVADCTKYIECYQGDSYLMSCPDGYWFDSRQKKCVLPQESDCEQTTTSPWTTPHPICWGIRPNQTVLKRYDGDCSKYWKCTGADLTLEKCPNHLYFDEERQTCDLPALVDCDDTTETPSPSTLTPPPSTTPSSTTPDNKDPRCNGDDISYLPDPLFCNKYIECYYDVSFEMSCPDGLFFTSDLKKCVNPKDSDCGRNKTSTTQRTSTTSRPTDITSDPDCPYPESEGKLLPYPGDCTKYYECAEGKKVAMDCPPSLWFNPGLLECDYPYQANCEWGSLTFWAFIQKHLFNRN